MQAQKTVSTVSVNIMKKILQEMTFFRKHNYEPTFWHWLLD